MGANTYYDNYTQSVTMTVDDFTKGLEWSTFVQNYNGDPASSYYDGTTVDYITEAPKGGYAPGGYYFLRKPHLGNTEIYFAEADNKPLSTYPTWNLTEIGPSGRTMQTSNFDGAKSWYDTWHSCS